MDVVKINDDTFEYRYNNKQTNFNQHVDITIVDANSVDPVSYPTAGLVWRWSHSDAGSSTIFVDNSVGLVANQPKLQDEAGNLGSETSLFLEITDASSISTALNFNISLGGQPVQGDYMTFETSTGNDYAVYFDIDASNTPPTGASYLSASNQVQINILSSDTPNQISSKLLSQLLIFGIAVDFGLSLSAGSTLIDVKEGNLVNAFGALVGWDNTNLSFESGDNNIAGYPIINVGSDYFDVANPYGKAMTATKIGSGSLLVTSTPIIEWRTNHSSRTELSSVSISSNIATATSTSPHKLNVGDTFTSIDIINAILPDTGVVLSIVAENRFTYASTNVDVVVSPAGFISKVGEVNTKYKIESLGYNHLHRLTSASGDSPLFTSLGIAVDDIMTISGKTFETINNGSFRVLAVDEDSIIYENINGKEELNTFIDFNNFEITADWVANADQITGIAGTFSNLNVGDWVKKLTDDDTFYVQISGFNTGNANTATIAALANGYSGITSSTVGHSLDQNDAIGTGVILKNTSDIRFFEGDSVAINDNIFITESTDPNWFEIANSGTFTIEAIGTNFTDGRVFLRVENGAGIAQTDVSMSVINTKFLINEADDNKFSTIKQIHNIVVDEFNPEKRVVYLTPGNRVYKWNQTNSTTISSLGKIGYSENITTGVDGYLYYTGLLRKVQRIIDGFEPDAVNFPGRKAVGSLIEVLPPLPRRVTVAIDVTTQDGVNLSEISDEITSVIINYVSNLGVGEDVILSDIIVRVKNIDGVAAVTFITPDPSEERIAISSDEKAFLESDDISIA